MVDVALALARWQMDEAAVRRRMIRSPTPRERERWHAVWLLAQGWSAAKVADLLERDPYTIGDWLSAFAEGGPPAMGFEQTGGAPRPRPKRASGVEGDRRATAAGGGAHPKHFEFSLPHSGALPQ